MYNYKMMIKIDLEMLCYCCFIIMFKDAVYKWMQHHTEYHQDVTTIMNTLVSILLFLMKSVLFIYLWSWKVFD